MNTWSNTVLTDKGLALMAKLTQGNTLNITKAMTGAGFVTPGVLVKQTEITDPKQSLSFRPASYPKNGTCAIAVVLRNEGLATGYEATQVGLFAEDPDEGEILFFITQAAEEGNGTTIPSETEMPGYSAEWTFYFKYGQASGVNIVVDPSNAVTQAVMEAYVHTTFNEMKTDINMAGHKITDVAEPTQGSDVATRNFVEQHTLEGNLYIAVDYNNDGNIVLKPYVADDDVDTLHTHLQNKENPHGVTIAQIGAAPADTYEKLHQKTKIPSGADLNAYTTPGSFAIVMASEGAGIANVPYGSACGTLIVTSMRSTKEDGNRSGVWQTFYGYDGNIYERSTTDGSTWREWWRAVSASGDTMTGALNAPSLNVIGDSWNAFTFKSAAEGNPVRGQIMISNNNRIHFNQQQTGANYAERYQLPTMASGLTADAWYNLVSTKHAKVLWNNGSPTSTFAAQTITINGLSDCTTIAVVMNQTNGDPFVTIICRTVGATHSTSPMAARSDSANANAIFVVRRSVTTSFSNNTISFGNGYQNNTENNARAIPIAVIGLY